MLEGKVEVREEVEPARVRAGVAARPGEHRADLDRDDPRPPGHPLVAAGVGSAGGDAGHVGAVVALGRVGAGVAGGDPGLRLGPVRAVADAVGGVVAAAGEAGPGDDPPGEGVVRGEHPGVDDRHLEGAGGGALVVVAEDAGGVEEVESDDAGRHVERQRERPVEGDRDHGFAGLEPSQPGGIEEHHRGRDHGERGEDLRGGAGEPVARPAIACAMSSRWAATSAVVRSASSSTSRSTVTTARG